MSSNSFPLTTSSRLIYRACLVLNKPIDELVNLLGFDIPVGPHVDLAGVKADGVVVHWKPSDERKSSTNRYEVQVNGNVGMKHLGIYRDIYTN